MNKIPFILALSLALAANSQAAGWGGGNNNSPSSTSAKPKAYKDHVYVVPDNREPGNTIATGNVLNNDINGVFAELISNPVGKYGFLTLSPSGEYKYELFDSSPKISALKVGERLSEKFKYRTRNINGKASKSKIIINIIGNPLDENGNTIFDDDSTGTDYDNVDIEYNDVSLNATAVNSGRTILGHLYASWDRDWYSLTSSTGADEIIDIELCPKGSVCYDRKNWVVYIFDADKLIHDIEFSLVPLSKWITDGTPVDISGNTYPYVWTMVNHMYALYRTGYYGDAFDGNPKALIGIIDPCFGSSGGNSGGPSNSKNSVRLGVKAGKQYFIAVSSPLLGDGSTEVCGQGSIILEKPDIPVQILKDGKPESAPTTKEYITAFPYSDDQYAIKLTKTGLDPLKND